MRVADIEIKAQPGKTRFVHERSQILWRAHLTGSVFDANRDTPMTRVQNQMLERAEGRVTLARVGGFTRAAHVKNHSRKRDLFRDIEGAFEFVHGLDAADAFDFADRKWLAALAGGAQVATGRRMKRGQREAIVSERSPHLLHLCLGAVVEVTARAENLQPGKAGIRNLSQQFARKFARYE